MTSPHMKIRSGDTVRIRSGKDRGKTGKVLSVLLRESRVVVEQLNTVKKHVRPQKQGQKGQVVEVPSPIPVSRVMLVCSSCKKGTRVGIARSGGKRNRERMCKKCNTAIG